MLGYQGKVGLVEQLFLTDRFQACSSGKLEPARWHRVAQQPNFYGMIVCPNQFLKALA
jgi:hypothetical protein